MAKNRLDWREELSRVRSSFEVSEQKTPQHYILFEKEIKFKKSCILREEKTVHLLIIL